MTVRKRTILLVDDDRSLRLSMKTLLQSHGFEVETAEDGREGFKAITQRQFDVVVMDIFMPKMNGRDCIRALKMSRPEVPVIILTGNTESELAHEALQIGAVAMLGKPVLAKELIEVIDRHTQAASTALGGAAGTA